MPEFEDQAYKFPDELTADIKEKDGEEAPGFEIEIEDDTPVVDRGKEPMPKPLLEELEKDELDAYDDNVKTKLKQMRKVWHDERREKEQALREHNEAVTFAQRILEENKRIKHMLTQGEKEYVSTIQNAAELALKEAKRDYKEAYDAGDTDKIIEAQSAMQAANLRLMQAKNFRMPSLQQENFEVQPQQQRQAPQVQAPTVDNKAVAWQQRNPWFGPNREMTALALGTHERLQDEGVIIGSDEYYEALDKTVRKRFPEVFGVSESKPEQSRTKPSTVVAPAVRTTSSNKVKLKTSQVQLAKKLGLTPEQYAQAVLKLGA